MFQILSQVFEPQKPTLSTIRGVWSRWDNENPQPFDGFEWCQPTGRAPLISRWIDAWENHPTGDGIRPHFEAIPTHIYIYICISLWIQPYLLRKYDWAMILGLSRTFSESMTGSILYISKWVTYVWLTPGPISTLLMRSLCLQQDCNSLQVS